jgi:hypothetical protein
MRYKIFLIALLTALLIPKASADSTGGIAADYLYNTTLSITHPGILNVPQSTPLGNQATYFDNTSTLAASITTATELTYLHGVTSPIQTQINSITRSSRTVNTVTTVFTIPALTADYILNANSTSFGFVVTLPDATASAGLCVDIKNIGSPANTITVSTQGGQTIDGGASVFILNSMDADHICAVGGEWFIY